jgi:hypothetical protein
VADDDWIGLDQHATVTMYVAKHPGATLVLLAEVAEGYRYHSHRFGHRFEAEDESQAWPHLHAVSREARKAYQADGTLAAWEALAQRAPPPAHYIGA